MLLVFCEARSFGPIHVLSNGIPRIIAGTLEYDDHALVACWMMAVAFNSTAKSHSLFADASDMRRVRRRYREHFVELMVVVCDDHDTHVPRYTTQHFRCVELR